MKIYLFILLTLLEVQLILSQNYLASLNKEKSLAGSPAYDGKLNYLKKQVHLYKGETMRFNCDRRHEKNDSSFVLGFTVDYKIRRDKYGPIFPKSYHPSLKGIGTDYHKIVNNKFKVLNVIHHPSANQLDGNNEFNHIYYLKLYNLTLKDTAYYEYFAFDKDRYFPFIVIKHQQYLTKKFVGKFYQVLGEQNDYVEVTDFKTMKPIKVFGKTWWKCSNMVTNDQNCEFSLILERDETRIIVPMLIRSYILKEG